MMDEQTLKKVIEVGRQAQETKQYLETNPYIKQVIERIQFNLLKGIMGLKSDQRDEFSAMKAAYDMAWEPLNYMEMDIIEGQRASDTLTGKTENGGIL